MTGNPNNTTITVPKTLVAQLIARRHPGQTIAGIIQELIDLANKTETPKTTTPESKI